MLFAQAHEAHSCVFFLSLSDICIRYRAKPTTLAFRQCVPWPSSFQMTRTRSSTAQVCFCALYHSSFFFSIILLSSFFLFSFLLLLLLLVLLLLAALLLRDLHLFCVIYSLVPFLLSTLVSPIIETTPAAATGTAMQFMTGSAFLVAPVYENTTTRDNIYLPAGEWYDFWSGVAMDGNTTLNGYWAPLEKLPIFVRAGSIIPMWPGTNDC